MLVDRYVVVMQKKKNNNEAKKKKNRQQQPTTSRYYVWNELGGNNHTVKPTHNTTHFQPDTQISRKKNSFVVVPSISYVEYGWGWYKEYDNSTKLCTCLYMYIICMYKHICVFKFFGKFVDISNQRYMKSTILSDIMS